MANDDDKRRERFHAWIEHTRKLLRHEETTPPEIPTHLANPPQYGRNVHPIFGEDDEEKYF